MTIRQVLDTLAEQGLKTTRGRIYQAIEAGYVPRPKRDGSFRYVFENKHVKKIAGYLKKPPRPGRKPAA